MNKPLKLELTPREWGLVESLFPDAAELGGAARTQFLDRHCTDEPGVRAELEAMLSATEDGTPFMAQPVSVSAPGALSQGLDEGAALGPWKILSLIGRGGMGEVYLAERADGVYAMRAAVKVLKRGLDTTAIVDRFLRERRILARLSHPNIARVLDAGSSEDGRPYLVMEHVAGAPITAYCRERSLPVRQIAGLIRTVAEAVAEAHRQHIVHRDLKPSNVLVTEQGQIKLLDFGVAKLLAENDDATRGAAGGLLLTPAYAAPEQILGLTITPAADVYALGTMAYLLFTGRMPQLREGLPAAVVAMSVRDEVTEKPSTAVLEAEGLAGIAERKRLARELSGDLDWIVLKAVQPEPLRRYSSAADLAGDLGNYLEHRPVRARPDSRTYRIGRFLRRYPLPVTATAVAVLALMTGLSISVWQYRQALQARNEAQKTAATMQAVNDFMNKDLLASADPRQGPTKDLTIKQMLDHAAANVGQRFGDKPEVAAQIHETLGATYHQIRQETPARAHLEQASRLYSELYGETSIQRMTVQGTLVDVLLSLGQHRQACVLADKLLALQMAQPAIAATTRLKTRDVHARCLRYLGKTKDAVAEYQEILNEVEALSPPDPKLLELALGGLSVSLLESGDPQGAAIQMDRLMELTIRTYGEKHFVTARLRFRRGEILHALHRLKEAEAELLQGARDQQAWIGADSMEVARFWILLGAVLLDQGRFDEAAAYARKYLVLSRAADSADSGGRLMVLVNLAEVAELRGRCAEVLKWVTQGLEVQATSTFPEEWYGNHLRARRAQCLCKSGKLAAARADLEHARSITITSHDSTVEDTVRELIRAEACVWSAEGETDNARAAYQKVLDLILSTDGPDNWRTKRAREELARAG